MSRTSFTKFSVVLLTLAILTGHAFAKGGSLADGLPNVSVHIGGTKGTGDVASSLQMLALLTILSLAPAIMLMTTAFTRIVIILSFVRQAIGSPTIPPNQVIIGLAMFLTFFVMAPTYHKVDVAAIKPLMQHKITAQVAIDRASVPMKDFMLRNTYEKDLTLFMNIRHEQADTPQQVSMVTLIPAFMISELKTSFIVGFYIFIPFVIIDLIVASVLMSMGMMMMPPTVISLPAKILVFVLANGWATVVAAIIAGYR